MINEIKIVQINYVANIGKTYAVDVAKLCKNTFWIYDDVFVFRYRKDTSFFIFFYLHFLDKVCMTY